MEVMKLNLIEIMERLASGESSESIGLGFERVSAAGVGCFTYGSLKFTTIPGGWACGKTSYNGVSLRLNYKLVDGVFHQTIDKYNPYTKTTEASNEFGAMSDGQVEKVRTRSFS